VGAFLPWFDGAVGAVCIGAALLGPWRRRRPGGPAQWSIWQSVMIGALGLCAWFSAIASLGRMSGFWYMLVYAGGLVALCAGVIGLARSPSPRR
jgi:peptidoglycan/LPS O-acetylase OafA/YrhL